MQIVIYWYIGFYMKYLDFSYFKIGLFVFADFPPRSGNKMLLYCKSIVKTFLVGKQWCATLQPKQGFVKPRIQSQLNSESPTAFHILSSRDPNYIWICTQASSLINFSWNSIKKKLICWNITREKEERPESDEGGKTHTLQRVWRPPLSCAYILKIPIALEHS